MSSLSSAVDLSTRYLGLELRSPLVASSSPLTGRLDSLLALEEAGVGAVVLPSLFEEDVHAEEMLLLERMEAGAGISSEAVQFFPDMPLGHLAIDRHLRLVEHASQALDIPVIASVNGYSAGGWVRYAAELVDAGASAIELNMYDLALDRAVDARAVEDGYAALVEGVVGSVDVPVAVKLSPYFSSLPNFADRLVASGAAGLVLFNRFFQPDIDVESLDVVPRLHLSHAGELHLPLRWIAILRGQLPDTCLALTSGVTSGESVIKGLLAGANAVMSASELLRKGPGRAAELLEATQAWLEGNGYSSVSQLRGSLARGAAGDSHAFERAQYRHVLESWGR